MFHHEFDDPDDLKRQICDFLKIILRQKGLYVNLSRLVAVSAN